MRELWKNRVNRAHGQRVQEKMQPEFLLPKTPFLCFHYHANFTLPRPDLGSILLKAPEA